MSDVLRVDFCRVAWVAHAPRRVALLGAILISLLASVARAGVFDVGTMRADRAEVLVDPNATPEVPSSPMLQRLSGVRAVLTQRDLSQLRASVQQQLPRVPLPESARRVAILRLGAASRTALVEVYQLQDGATLARELDATSAEPQKLAAKIDRAGWDKVARTLDQYGAGFDAPAMSGKPLDATETGTIWPAPWIVDGDEIDRRFTGRQVDRTPASRDLSIERFAIHVGPGISAQRPAALLVWLSPVANATIPESLAAAATMQGFVVIAPTDAGSTRDLTNRIQLALDAAYGAQSRWHIDPERVYVGGFSAGGGLANLIWMAFPDVFRGTVLVSGTSFYQEVQAGPSAYWPRQFNEPVRANMKLLAGKRSAVVVGENDPGRPHVVAVAKRMSLESIRAESFVVAGLAHEIPDQAAFVKALRWVDTDADDEWTQRSAKGDALLTAATEARDAVARRRALIAVTREAPWTPAAWKAAANLKQDEAAK